MYDVIRRKSRYLIIKRTEKFTQFISVEKSLQLARQLILDIKRNEKALRS